MYIIEWLLSKVGAITMLSCLFNIDKLDLILILSVPNNMFLNCEGSLKCGWSVGLTFQCRHENEKHCLDVRTVISTLDISGKLNIRSCVEGLNELLGSWNRQWGEWSERSPDVDRWVTDAWEIRQGTHTHGWIYGLCGVFFSTILWCVSV